MRKTNEQRIAELERRIDELTLLVRFGTVTTVDTEAMTCRVSFDNGIRSAVLPVLQNGTGWLPQPGQRVISLHRPAEDGAGYILGAFSAPTVDPLPGVTAQDNGKVLAVRNGVWAVMALGVLLDETVFRFDDETDTLEINTE